ncbi:hypothetical protein PInf_021466 [Phytophthora infestans]|nr:hypothetical protein PInf_021466 [Phytophthora infestans]
MPRGTLKSGAKTRSKTAAGKAQAKSAKPHGKGSALQEATQVASEAIGSAGDAAVSKRASKRRSPSPSAALDNRPSPRFAEREFDSASEDEAESFVRSPRVLQLVCDDFLRLPHLLTVVYLHTKRASHLPNNRTHQGYLPHIPGAV